jgi:hypothetical protein
MIGKMCRNDRQEDSTIGLAEVGLNVRFGPKTTDAVRAAK